MATGTIYSVKNFVQEAFKYVGLDWKRYVEVDKRYFRPTEVDALIGDSTKAKKVLKWKPKMDFQQLVHVMVDADMELVKKKLYGEDGR